MFDALSVQALRILQQIGASDELAIFWQCSREDGRGDISTSVALSLAKGLKKKPQEVAELLAKGLQTVGGVERAEVAGNGYVNVWLTPAALFAELAQGRKTQLAKVKEHQKTKKHPVIVEYSQPNIAKPLGVHHLIGTVLGQATVNLYKHMGYPVVSWNYIGDWGTQFGKLAVAYEKWGKGKAVKSCSLQELLALYVRFHEEVEADATLEEQGREAFRKLEQGDAALRKFWEDVVAVTKASLAGVYDRLHVSFDLDLGESFYEDKMQPVLEEGRKKKVFVEGESGALIVQFPEEKQLPPYLVLKGDGATLYSTRDLAQMRYRMDKYDPQSILIFTDIAQKLHFEQLVETCTQLGWTLPPFENVLYGRMRFVDSSMSTRKGNILSLEQVLNEAVERADKVIEEHGDTIQTDDRQELAEMMGIGALVYGILSQNRKMDIVFDWNKMLSFEGNSAPYLQYTHARARSVLRKADAKKPALPADATSLASSERQLLRTLLLFPRAVDEALETHMPHKLANFLFQLAQDFNAFYNIEPILKAEHEERSRRLALTAETADVLNIGADLLTLRMPDRM